MSSFNSPANIFMSSKIQISKIIHHLPWDLGNALKNVKITSFSTITSLLSQDIILGIESCFLLNNMSS